MKPTTLKARAKDSAGNELLVKVQESRYPKDGAPRLILTLHQEIVVGKDKVPFPVGGGWFIEDLKDVGDKLFIDYGQDWYVTNMKAVMAEAGPAAEGMLEMWAEAGYQRQQEG